MNPSKANNILSSQSGLARKVFSVVPMQEYWPIQQIMNELRRSVTTTATQGDVLGCLRTLVDAGLVSEIQSMQFRSNVKPVRETAAVKIDERATTPKASLLDRLANKAEELRTIADSLDDLAVEVAETLNAQNEDTAKLKQLQATLRGLMG